MATVSYNKLWKMLINKGMSKGKNEDVRVAVLVKIYVAPGCTIDDIMEIIPDKETAANG